MRVAASAAFVPGMALAASDFRESPSVVGGVGVLAGVLPVFGILERETAAAVTREVGAVERAAITDTSRLLEGRAAVTVARETGLAFEDQVRTALGTFERGTLVGPSGRTRFPDLPVGTRFGIADIKDVRDIQFRSQMRDFVGASVRENLPLGLIVSPKTETVASSILRQIQFSRGKIFRFDPATSAFSEIPIPVTGTRIVP